MSDLISREKVTKEISEIMADVLISGFRRKTVSFDELNHKIQECIKNQPIAYDLESVMGQLGEKTELAHQRYMDCPSGSPCFTRYLIQYTEREMCLEIVKSGVNAMKGEQEDE